METNYSEREQHNRAQKRVEELKGFYGHLAAYIGVNVFFLVINLLTTPNDIWFFWPMLGWGLGVMFHGFRVFNVTPFFGKEWEERKVREFMEKEEESRKNELKNKNHGKL